MWAGQLSCEAFNWLLKRAIKQDRPIGMSPPFRTHTAATSDKLPITDSLGHGYGFPSSHSQYMGFFASFLMCHLYFRHRFASCGYPILDRAWRLLLYVGIGGWAVAVAYSRCGTHPELLCRSGIDPELPQFSRYHLTYHTPHQIIWGFAIGTLLGLSLYITTEFIPRSYPTSLLARAKNGLLGGTIATWLQIRDGWDVWSDGGREDEWVRWRAHWDQWRRKKQ